MNCTLSEFSLVLYDCISLTGCFKLVLCIFVNTVCFVFYLLFFELSGVSFVGLFVLFLLLEIHFSFVK